MLTLILTLAAGACLAAGWLLDQTVPVYAALAASGGGLVLIAAQTWSRRRPAARDSPVDDGADPADPAATGTATDVGEDTATKDADRTPGDDAAPEDEPVPAKPAAAGGTKPVLAGRAKPEDDLVPVEPVAVGAAEREGDLVSVEPVVAGVAEPESDPAPDKSVAVGAAEPERDMMPDRPVVVGRAEPEETLEPLVARSSGERLADDSTVHVLSGRRRFHAPGCRLLDGRDAEELTLIDAREEAFTPCTICVTTETKELLADRA